MELEEAIKRCKHIVQNFNDMRKYELPPHKFTINSEDSDCIEKILVELQNSISKEKIEEVIKEELPDDEICAVCDIYDVNGVEIKQKLQELLEKPNE